MYVDGNMTKGDVPACFIRGDDGVIGPWIYLDLPVFQIRTVPVVGETHAARIEIPGIDQTSQLLSMGMPTRHQGRVKAAQELANGRISSIGEDDIVERVGRTVEAEQLFASFQWDLDGWLKLAHKGHVVFRELRERPFSDSKLPFAHLLMRGRFLAGNQPSIGITHDDGTI
ncbi:MAG TPA: hypothetical protein VF510_01070 [Ktedonobacterales bacterium]